MDATSEPARILIVESNDQVALRARRHVIFWKRERPLARELDFTKFSLVDVAIKEVEKTTAPFDMIIVGYAFPPSKKTGLDVLRAARAASLSTQLVVMNTDNKLKPAQVAHFKAHLAIVSALWTLDPLLEKLLL